MITTRVRPIFCPSLLKWIGSLHCDDESKFLSLTRYILNVVKGNKLGDTRSNKIIKRGTRAAATAFFLADVGSSLGPSGFEILKQQSDPITSTRSMPLLLLLFRNSSVFVFFTRTLESTGVFTTREPFSSERTQGRDIKENAILPRDACRERYAPENCKLQAFP